MTIFLCSYFVNERTDSTFMVQLVGSALLLVGVIVNVVNAALFLLINEIVRDQSQQATLRSLGDDRLREVVLHRLAAGDVPGAVAELRKAIELNGELPRRILPRCARRRLL